MKSANIIFPHQLFEKSPISENGHRVYLVEEKLYFRQFKFLRQKIALHRAAMKSYKALPELKGVEMHCIESVVPLSDIRKLVSALGGNEIEIRKYNDLGYQNRLSKPPDLFMCNSLAISEILQKLSLSSEYLILGY